MSDQYPLGIGATLYQQLRLFGSLFPFLGVGDDPGKLPPLVKMR